jgi:hypothetical protein
MKHIILLVLLIGSAVSSFAQTSAGWAGKERPETVNATPADPDFSKTTISLHQHKLSFSHLPEMTKSATVSFTNKDGDVVRQVKINTVEKSIDLSYMDKGTYFLKLAYRGAQKKGFVLNL